MIAHPAIFRPVRMGWTVGISPMIEAVTGKAGRGLAAYARDDAAAWRA